MNIFRVCLLGALVLSGSVAHITPTLAGDAQRPVPVSPGEPGWLMTIDTLCPTFSWAGVAGASNYQIEIYDVPDDPSVQSLPAVDPGTVIRQKIVPGTATSWFAR